MTIIHNIDLQVGSVFNSVDLTTGATLAEPWTKSYVVPFAAGQFGLDWIPKVSETLDTKKLETANRILLWTKREIGVIVLALLGFSAGIALQIPWMIATGLIAILASAIIIQISVFFLRRGQFL